MKLELMVFQEKIPGWGKLVILDPELVHPQSSGSILKIF